MAEPLMSRVSDDETLRRWHQVGSASADVDYVGFPADPIEETRSVLEAPSGGDDYQLYVGDVEGVPVAAVIVRSPIHDNLDLANVSVWIHPDHRRLGYGRWALEQALGSVRAMGRRKVLIEVPAVTRSADPSPGQVFVTSIGAQPMLSSTRRLLDLERMSATHLASLADETATASKGYSTVAWRDHTPEPLVDDMAALHALMSTDPPQGELVLEPEVWDAARYRDLERSCLERGRHHLVVAAREDASGRLVGYTDLGVAGGGAPVGYQWDTIVRAEHRGHRLGLLMKLANLRELRAQLPTARYLNTFNAVDNAQMVDVNEQLGYQPMEVWTEWQIDL